MVASKDNTLDFLIRLTSSLVAIPSQGGVNAASEICHYVATWMRENRVETDMLFDEAERPLAVTCELGGNDPGPTICLCACLDTAPIGTREKWDTDPFQATRSGTRLYGRGVADSKSGAAIFARLASDLNAEGSVKRGKIFFLFDADEHTGQFGGIRAFMKTVAKDMDFVVLGYPGNDRIVRGSRGFLRVQFTTQGVASHTGAKTKALCAIHEAANIISALTKCRLPVEGDSDFSFGPKITVTEVSGGKGYSIVPDECNFKVDIRLTPSFDERKGKKLLEEVVSQLRVEGLLSQSAEIRYMDSWPYYKIDPGNRFLGLFRDIAETVFDKDIALAISGPSNIGNLLAASSIPVMSGFGATYGNIHAPNEFIEIHTVPKVYETYKKFCETVLG